MYRSEKLLQETYVSMICIEGVKHVKAMHIDDSSVNDQLVSKEKNKFATKK